MCALSMELLLLAGVVALGFTVETALGFGATLVAVSLGSGFLPLELILPAFVPVNMALSLLIVARHRGQVALRFLLGRLLPFMVLGLPLGFVAFSALPELVLRRIFGAFLLALIGVDVWQLVRPAARQGPLPRAAEALLLLVGGAIHGAFGTGGPIAVYVSKQALAEKGSFRATLSALWLLLNTLVVAGYAVRGLLGADSAARSLSLLPALGLGLILGELIHRRVNTELFRRLVLGMLFVVALSLFR